jgi:hypothetical protein
LVNYFISFRLKPWGCFSFGMNNCMNRLWKDFFSLEIKGIRIFLLVVSLQQLNN